MKKTNIFTGIAWYTPEQWSRLKLFAADASELEETYDDWKNTAEDAIQELVSGGLHVRKINVDIQSLEKWCDDKGLSNNSKARSQYAAERCSEMESQENR